MKNQHLIDNLSTSEKADLFQHLYAELAGQGTDGDTELAHVNRFEAQVLRNIGGSGTVNKVTGLRQYGKGGGSAPPQPTTTTTRQVPEYAPEQREYIKDIFGKSQELYEQRMGEGYQAGPGNRMADWDPRETEAFTGMAGLARGPGAAPAYEIARQASLGAAAPITAAEIQQGMNPYQQSVTDIGKREAVRDYQMGPLAQLRSGAAGEGGLRGTRRFVAENAGERNLNQQLGDMQTRGSDRAYQQSMAEAAASRGRLANLAAQMPGIGQGAYDQQMRQYGQLGGVGEVYRQRQQAGIDLAQQQFLQQEAFPEEQLGRYLRFITNAPSPSGFQQTMQTPGVSGPSGLTQLLGGLGGAAALGKAFFNRGGPIGRQAGLSGVVRRAGGGQIVRMQQGRTPADAFTSQFGQDVLRSADLPYGGKIPYDGFGARRRKEEQVQEIIPDLIKEGADKSPFVEYLFGTPESYEESKNALEKFVDKRPTEFPEAFEDQYGETTKPEDMIAAASFGDEDSSKNSDNKTPAPEQKTISFKQVEAPAAAPQETKSAFMSGLDDLSTGDLLKMAGAFFTAGGQGSTGSMSNDALNFLGSAGVTAGDVLSKAQQRKLGAAEKAELLSLKKRQVGAEETKARAAMKAAGLKNRPTYKTPNKADIAYTKTNLTDKGFNVSDAAVRQIAALQKANDHLTHEEVIAGLLQQGTLKVDEPGFFRSIWADPEIQLKAE